MSRLERLIVDLTAAVQRLEKRHARGPWVVVCHPDRYALVLLAVEQAPVGAVQIQRRDSMHPDDVAIGETTRRPIPAEHVEIEDAA